VTSINVTGGSQNDTIYIAPEIDIGAWIDVGAGDDYVQGGSGDDTIVGGTGDDTLLGAVGFDSIDGGDGDDRLEGAAGSDTLDGGTGDDVLAGQLGHDVMRGGVGNDVVWGGRGNDLLSGGAGNDSVDGRLGNNIVIDGFNSDTIVNANKTVGQTIDSDTGQIIDIPSVVSLTLMNANTGQPIRQLSDGAVLDLKTLPTRNLNVLANLGSTVAGSVRFSVDGGSTYHVDDVSPYNLSNVWQPGVGAHTVTATPYTEAGATGVVGDSKTVTFRVVDTTGENTDPNNKVPTVRIVNPVTNTTKVGPAQYIVRAAAADVDGRVSKVEFYVGNTLIGVTNDQPYSVSWTDVLPGTYTLTARAFDNKGAATTSSVVTVTVKPFTAKMTYYVSPSGSDNNAGAENSPFKTITRAANLATAGDLVLINPGTYRESVLLKNSGTSDRPITFKAVTPGTVVIDGADVISGWTKQSGSIYATDWAHDFKFNGARTWIFATGTWGYAEQFMVGNTPLTRVLDGASMREGTFTIDYNTDKVSVWLPGSADPRSTNVLGSTRSTLFAPRYTKLGTAENIRVEGLTFRHASNFMQNEHAAVRTDNGWVLVDVTVKQTNSTGLGVRGNDVTVLRVTTADNGQNGMGSGGGTNVLVKDSITRGNNYRDVKVDWEGGGGKWAKTDGLFMTNYKAHDNRGHGIWFDIDNRNFVIEKSEAWNNVGVSKIDEGTGIFMEISPGPARIEGNYVHNNSGAAIRIAESSNVIVQDNTLVNNFRGVELRDMPDRPYTVLNVTVRNNRIRGWAESAIGTLQGTWNTSTARNRNIVIENNQFNFLGSSTNRLFRWGPTSFLNLGAVQSTLGFEKTGVMASNF